MNPFFLPRIILPPRLRHLPLPNTQFPNANKLWFYCFNRRNKINNWITFKVIHEVLYSQNRPTIYRTFPRLYSILSGKRNIWRDFESSGRKQHSPNKSSTSNTPCVYINESGTIVGAGSLRLKGDRTTAPTPSVAKKIKVTDIYTYVRRSRGGFPKIMILIYRFYSTNAECRDSINEGRIATGKFNYLKSFLWEFRFRIRRIADGHLLHRQRPVIYWCL